jgi:hypothetical protein
MSAGDFIATQQATYPDLAERYAKLEELHSKK